MREEEKRGWWSKRGKAMRKGPRGQRASIENVGSAIEVKAISKLRSGG